ncbi:hypothetical protein [Allosalinactinospora lopnorensis]|uniref:hypothetical protein n=1 Tax=Allosalinactinospora lopnorensis TaxID=1352348 RepID=UPI0012E10543|nr:hypothetical protein [Allosalinactinospora lopnorensis]
MAARNPTRRSLAARKAITTRHHPDADTSDLDREIKVAGLAERIREVVNSAPALTPEDAARLRALLPAPDNQGGQDAA